MSRERSLEILKTFIDKSYLKEFEKFELLRLIKEFEEFDKLKNNSK